MCLDTYTCMHAMRTKGKETISLRVERTGGEHEGGQLGKAGGKKAGVERFNSTSTETILAKNNIKDGVAKGDKYSSVGDF